VRVVAESAAGVDRPRSSARATRAAVLALVCFVLFAVLAVAVQMGWSQALDLRLMLALAPHRPVWATHIMRTASFLGSGSVEIPLGLLFSLRLATIRRRPEAAGYASATLSGWALYGLLKFLFQRARPHVIPRLMSGGGGWYAFPSGHASLAPLVFGLGALIWSAPWPRARRLAVVGAAALLSLLIAFSRVYIGVHWPTDAIGGLLMGTGWAALWVWWWERAGQLSPSSASLAA
jgi:undecaprenyl-diphosphatase